MSRSPLPLVMGCTGAALAAIVVGSLSWVIGSALVWAAAGVLLRERRSWRALSLVTVAGTVAALGVVYRAPSAIIIVGSFALTGVAILLAHRRLLASRRGSLVWELERSGLWIPAAVSVAIVTALTHRLEPGVTGLVATATALLVAIAIALVARRICRRIEEAVARTVGPAEADLRDTVDLGVGDEAWSMRAPAPFPYRSNGRTAIFRGSLHEARRCVRRRRLRTVASVLVSFAAFALLLGSFRWVPSAVLESAIVPMVEPWPVPETGVIRTGYWFPGQHPIVTDVNDDGVEDLVSHRFIHSGEHSAVFVTANDGRRFEPLWATAPVPSAWKSWGTRLAHSVGVVFLTDSQHRVHLYEAATGSPLGAPVPIPSFYTMCAASNGRLWIGDDDGKRDGFMVGALGRLSRAPEPNPCVDDPWAHIEEVGSRSPCYARFKRDEPSLMSLDVSGRDGVAWTDDLLFGFDAKTCTARRWTEALAFTSEPLHARPAVRHWLRRGTLYSGYRTRGRRWVIGARDPATGAARWSLQLPRRDPRAKLQELFVSRRDRVYVAMDAYIEVVDAERGTLLGTM